MHHRAALRADGRPRKKLDAKRKKATSGSPDAALEAKRSNAAIGAVGHAHGRMSLGADAIVLVLTTEHALAPRITMAVAAAAAERGRRRGHRRDGGGQNDNPEQQSRKFLHNDLPMS